MKINDKTLSIPPFISTSWKNITAIHMKGAVLAISLVNGESIEIPNLKPEIIELIFANHALYIEKESSQQNPNTQMFTNKRSFQQASTSSSEAPPFKFELGGLEALGAALHHNPANANAPDLPPEILNKISMMAKMMGPEEIASIPKAEPHCNCVYCQIARVMTNETAEPKEAESHAHEEHLDTVADEELHFQEWNITNAGENLYTVTNKLDPQEKYNVYLGHPVGCTCGKQGCEHILAVLKS